MGRSLAVIAFLAVAVFGLVLVYPDGNRDVRDAPAIKTVLFLGNSYVMAKGGLHNHLRKLTQSRFPGASGVFYFKSMSKGGAWLSYHAAQAGDMIANFSHGKKDGPWDLVVLQGQSSEPIYSMTRFASAARQLDGKIRKSGSRTAFFMTWAYKNNPEMTGKLSDGYTSIAKELDALVVPVGLAFANARYKNPNMELYDKDGRHPSLLGTYLAANVFFVTLYEQSPVGASYNAGLSEQEAKFAQSVAWKTVKEYIGK